MSSHNRASGVKFALAHQLAYHTMSFPKSKGIFSWFFKEFTGLLPIFQNLCLQFRQGGKFAFRAEIPIKFQSQLPTVEVPFMVQKLGLYRDRFAAYRGAFADVGHRRAVDLLPFGLADIDAEGQAQKRFR